MDSVTLAQVGGVVRFTPGVARTQWDARAVFNETETEYVIVWSDSRFAEGDFEIRRQRMTSGGLFILGGFILAGGEGSQVAPEIASLLGDSPLPRYVVTWQDDAVSMDHAAKALFLDVLALPVGSPLALSSDPLHNQYLPQVVSNSQSPATLLAAWQHGPLPDYADIHGQVFSSVEPITITDTSPADWAMVLSLRPTFRWSSFEGAVTYRLTLQGGELQEPMVLDLDADQTADLDRPGRDRWKLTVDLSSGTTLNDAGYAWTVEAFDASGRRLASSLLSQFQIPPLGFNPGNGDWNRFDDLIYRWSEARDLPPALVKAVLAKETGGIHSYQNGDPPEASYLYEPRKDHLNCVLGGPRNVCFDTRVAPYKQPGAGTVCPRQLGSVNGVAWDDNPTIADMGADPTEPFHQGAGLSNWASLQKLTDCFQNPFSGRSFFECVVDWFGGRDDVPPAQYRLMASYGLGQVTYWQNFKQEALDPYEPNPGTGAPPETLYRPDVNIQAATKLLSDKRCAWQRFDSHGVHDPLIPDYIFLNAANYDPQQFLLWRQALPAYAGYVFYSPQAVEVQRYFNRVGDFYLGQNGETSTQPFDLSSGGAAVIPAEGAPPQTYQGLGDAVPQPCPLPEAQASTENGMDLATPISLSPSSEQVVLDQELVDFEGDGEPEQSLLVWFGDPEANPLGSATVRIYDPSSGDALLWESPTMGSVTTDGVSFATEQPASARQMLQLEWPEGAHGTRSYVVGSFGSGFGFVPVIQPSDVRFDFTVSDGGGAVVLVDGSLAVLERGPQTPLEQTVVDIYAFDGSAFRWARTYLLDQNVTDTTSPTTEVEVVPAANPQGWAQPPVTVVLSASDDHALRFIEYTLSGLQGDLHRVSALDRLEIPFEEGRWTLAYGSLDGYGNEETPHQIAVLVDGTAPVTEARVEGSQGNDGWFVSGVQISLQASDQALKDGSPGSGVAGVEYSLDEGLSWEAFAAPFAVEQEGVSTVLYRARDAAGNEEEPKALEVRIDSRGPTVSLSLEPRVLWPPNNKLVPVTLAGTATDPGSGILLIQFEVIDEYAEWEPRIEALTPSSGDAAEWQFPVELRVAREGQDMDGPHYLVRVIAFDVAGNRAEEEAIVIVPHDQSR